MKQPTKQVLLSVSTILPDAVRLVRQRSSRKTCCQNSKCLLMNNFCLNRWTLLCLLWVAVIAPLNSFAANVIANGGFEAASLPPDYGSAYKYNPTDQAPWVFNGDSGTTGPNSPFTNNGTYKSYGGQASAFIQGNGSIYQSFNVVNAGTYQLTFLAGNRNTCGELLDFSVDGAVLYRNFNAPASPYAYFPTNAQLPLWTLSAGTHTLTIQGHAPDSMDCSMVIDNLNLSPAVPAQILTYIDTYINGHGIHDLVDSTYQYDFTDYQLHWTFNKGGIASTNTFFDGRPGQQPNGPPWDPEVQAFTSWRPDANPNGIATPNGNVAFVRGNGSMSQTWIDNGGQYQLSIAGSRSQLNDTPLITVYVDGTPLRSFNGLSEFFYFSTDVFSIGPGAHTVTFGSENGAALFYAPRLIPYTSGAGAARFNAVESSYQTGMVGGYIHTKVVDTSFTVDIVAMEDTSTAVRTDFVGNVSVELVDASDSSGSDLGNGCRSSYKSLPSRPNISLSFGASDKGRKTVTLTEANAWRNVRVRVTRIDAAPAATSCSADAFAIRPDKFVQLAVSDSDYSSAGTSRLLNNTALNGGVVHKAGQPFSLKANAVNPAGDRTLSGYDGTPSINLTPCSDSGCPSVIGTWTPIAGQYDWFYMESNAVARYGNAPRWHVVGPNGYSSWFNCSDGYMGGDPTPGSNIRKQCQIVNNDVIVTTPTASAGIIDNSTAYYTGVGAVRLQLVDNTFTAVDSSDGSTGAERTFYSQLLDIGRFVPDHYDIALVTPPVLQTFGANCAAPRTFTYVGQPFGWATAPTATIIARSKQGNQLGNYANAFWKLTAANVTQALTSTSAPVTINTGSFLPPVLQALNDGSGSLAAAPGSTFKFQRPSTVVAPFNANLSLGWTINDLTEVGPAGNGQIVSTAFTSSTIAFDGTSAFRFGTLRIVPAYGSELVNLPVSVESQYWDGNHMTTNAADSCTAIPANAISLANYQRNLTTCAASPGSAVTTLKNGRGYLTFARPGAGKSGSVDATLVLAGSTSGQACLAVGSATTPVPAGLSHLQGRWGAAGGFDQNPAARVSFGQYKSPVIYMRQGF